MVEPMPPRFVREGDRVQIPVKVSNKSSGRLSGIVRFALFDARTNDSRDALIQDENEQSFDLPAGASEAVFFTVFVADGTDVLRYRATGTTTGSARHLSDGEEATLPVLPRKVLVTETIPVTVRGGEQRTVVLEKLLESKKSGSSAIQNESLAIQAVSNPAWYAVMALPYLMERSDESVDALFYRLYANAYAEHLVTGDPRIEKIFEQWRGTKALNSPLEKNEVLVKTLLAETPWVRDATSETEARARVANLFNTNRVRSEVSSAIERFKACGILTEGGRGFREVVPATRLHYQLSRGLVDCVQMESILIWRLLNLHCHGLMHVSLKRSVWLNNVRNELAKPVPLH